MVELVKKLSMKKTFFVTQLESFFSSITQEFQEKITNLEVENKILIERNKKLEYDVNNLVKIKNELQVQLESAQDTIDLLSSQLERVKEGKALDYPKVTLENERLKKEIENLKDKIRKLEDKSTIKPTPHRVANAYNQTMMQKKNEEIIKEITKNLKK